MQTRKLNVVLALALLVLFLIPATAFASGQEEEFPSRPITLICPWAAGGGTDRTARFIAEQLSDVLGTPVNVSNQTGGNGAVGHSAAANADPNGYTIGNVTFEVAALEYLGYSDVTPDDYTALMQFNQDPAAVIVRADAEWDTVDDLLEDIRQEPAGTYTFAGSGTASVWDLARVGMLNSVGIDPNKVKYIPTKGAAPAITEMLGGEVDVLTSSYPEAAAQIESGDLKALGIMAEDRVPLYEDVPTLKEQGVDWVYGTWRGFTVPEGTPEERVQVLQDALMQVVQSEEFEEFMANNQFGIKIREGEEFMDFMMTTYRELEEIIEVAGYGE
ncbi:MAG: tripartite tricarboxylate transporter substrate binding protein [Spirochaetes bacterium]|jgi:tripartite-type tricarboxylate transporter receptor subunit TctC|nr:tripartite tricarboxylate transporter substrate binding protein [Spirochaetota bacterium]